MCFTKLKARKKPLETLQCTAAIKIKTSNCYGKTLYNYHGLLDNKGHLLVGLNCNWIMDPEIYFHI